MGTIDSFLDDKIMKTDYPGKLQSVFKVEVSVLPAADFDI